VSPTHVYFLRYKHKLPLVARDIICLGLGHKYSTDLESGVSFRKDWCLLQDVNNWEK